MTARGLAALLRDLAYPPRCPFCDQVLGFLPVCPACAPLAQQLELAPCRLPPADHCLLGLDGAASAYLYQGVVQQAVLRMKYAGRACYGAPLGRAMAGRLFGCTFSVRSGIITTCTAPPAALEYDLVVPVPPSGKSRGYNPPQCLAVPLAKALGLPLAPRALRKVRETPRQEELDRGQRLANLAGAFAADPAQLPPNARVLLVDDVITTGATVAACAAALQKAGVQSVFAVSLAVSRPHSGPDA